MRSFISVHELSPADLAHLGHNTAAAVRQDRNVPGGPGVPLDHEAAIDRSLEAIGELDPADTLVNTTPLV